MISGAQRNEMEPRARTRPPSRRPSSRPATTAYRMNTAISERSGGGRLDRHGRASGTRLVVLGDAAAGDALRGRAPRGGGATSLLGSDGRHGCVKEGRGDRRAVAGPREEVALTELASELPQRVELTRLLDALRDDAQVERPAEGHHRPSERPVVRSAVGAADELPRDLQDVDLEAAEISERGIAGPEV